MQNTEMPSSESRIMQSYYIRKDINRELQAILQREETEHPRSPIARMIQSWN